MRPVNLIPLDERRGERAPLRTGPLAYVLVGAMLLAFVGIYVLVSAGNAISDHESQLSGLEQQLDSSQARADALQSFTEFATLEESRTQTVSDLARSRFDWERVLRELALVIPGDVSLTNVTGKVSAETATGSSAGGSSSGGASTEGIEAPTLTISGCASTHESVATFVAALRDIDGVTRVGLQSSAKSQAEGESDTGTAAAGSEGSCVRATSFELSVAFDGVQVDPTTGAIVPSAPPPATGDEAGLADAKAEQSSAKESAGAAVKKGNDAVDKLIPGA